MSDQPDNQSSDDKKISALYRAGSTAQPPEHIDQAIRAEARRSVSPMSRRVRSPWTVPVSMVAVLVLSVTLISLIHEEAPTVSDIHIRPDLPAIHEKMEIAESATKAKSVTSPETAGNQLSLAETANMAQPDTEQKTERQTTTAKPFPSPQKKLASAQFKEEPTSGATIEADEEILQESLRRTSPQPESRSPATPGLAGGADAKFSTGLKKDLRAKTGENCELSSHSACLDSEQCSLIMNEQKALVCHRSTNHCDSGFIQRSDTKESCETRQGCMYVSDPCFCPPDVICVCDGGQPPQCQPRKNGTQIESGHPVPK